MASRVQIPFSFNYPSGGNLLPAANASIAVYIRNPDGSQGSSAAVFQAQSGAAQYASLQTDLGGNVPGWVAEGSYRIVAAASGGFGGGVINFDALYGGGTAQIAPGVVDVTHLTSNLLSYLVPAGTILDHAGAAAPAGFLACNGGIIAQATYPNLYNAIGSTWNTTGEGAGNFRLPNLIGTMTMGAGTASWGTLRTLGKYGLPSGGTYLGEEIHTLSATEMPVHTHGDYGHGHNDNGHAHSVYDPGHKHNVTTYLGTATGTFNWGSNFTTHGYGGDVWDTTYVGTGIGIYTAYASITTGYASLANAGGGGFHNTMPPFAVVNKIIKT